MFLLLSLFVFALVIVSLAAVHLLVPILIIGLIVLAVLAVHRHCCYDQRHWWHRRWPWRRDDL